MRKSYTIYCNGFWLGARGLVELQIDARRFPDQESARAEIQRRGWVGDQWVVDVVGA